MRKRTWTDEEIAFLHAHYKAMTRKQMADAINCSLIVLARKMKELGLYQRDKPPELGDMVGKLTVLSIQAVKKRTQTIKVATCSCECGAVFDVPLTKVTNGYTIDCGCSKPSSRDRNGEPRHTRFNNRHGKSSSKLYRTWAQMKSRCYNPNCPVYCYYGAKGVTVCDEWRKDFLAFETWAITNGYRKELTIDRIDSSGNYEPKNCRWSTRKTQNINRTCNRIDTVMITAFSETKSARLWLEDARCRIACLRTLFYRIGAGWSPERAIATPPKQ